MVFSTPYRNGSDFRSFKIIKPRVGKPVSGIILSGEILSHQVHWWNERTVPCLVPDPCLPCQRGSAPRLEAWVYLRDEAGVIQIFALPYYPALALAKLQQTRKTLRGVAVLAERIGATDRSRIRLTVKDAGTDFDDEAELPDIRAILKRIWGIQDNLAAVPPIDA